MISFSVSMYSFGGTIGCYMDLWEREDAADILCNQKLLICKPMIACFSHCFVPASKFQLGKSLQHLKSAAYAWDSTLDFLPRVPIFPYLKLGISLEISSDLWHTCCSCFQASWWHVLLPCHSLHLEGTTKSCIRFANQPPPNVIRNGSLEDDALVTWLSMATWNLSAMILIPALLLISVGRGISNSVKVWIYCSSDARRMFLM